MQRRSSEDIAALNSMTLQIGLIGIDGVVIASDRLSSGWEGLADRNVSMTSKFREGNGFICCWAGDNVSKYAAANICKLELKYRPEERKRETIRKALEGAGTEAWKQRFGSQTEGTNGTIRKVIAACPDGTLWLLEFDGQHPSAIPKYDKVVSGDVRNSAGFFINNYLPRAEMPIRRPVTQLIFAAAHAVMVGARENTSGVGGVEVVVIRNGQPPFFLTPEQEDVLKKRSEQLDRFIYDQLLQEFTL